MAKVEFKISPNHIRNVLCSGEARIKLVKEDYFVIAKKMVEAIQKDIVDEIKFSDYRNPIKKVIESIIKPIAVGMLSKQEDIKKYLDEVVTKKLDVEFNKFRNEIYQLVKEEIKGVLWANKLKHYRKE